MNPIDRSIEEIERIRAYSSAAVTRLLVDGFVFSELEKDNLLKEFDVILTEIIDTVSIDDAIKKLHETIKK